MELKECYSAPDKGDDPLASTAEAEAARAKASVSRAEVLIADLKLAIEKLGTVVVADGPGDRRPRRRSCYEHRLVSLTTLLPAA
jgi:hypothetical protein